MLETIPLTLWLKWGVMVATIISVYGYFGYMHRYHHKRSHAHPLTVAANNRYFRDIGILLTLFGVLAVAYVVKTDMVIRQQKQQLWELVAEPAPSPEPVAEPAPPPQAPLSPAEKDTALDALKEKYEILFVNHFVLRKCGFHGNEEYTRLISLYREEAAPFSPPKNLEINLLTAAEGSYTELYSTTSCTTTHTRDLRVKMDKFMGINTP